MSDLTPLPQAPLGRYRHYKGNEYEVLGVVRHSETLEPLVLYRPLYNDSGLWVRPYAMFFEEVDVRHAPSFFFLMLGAVHTTACPASVTVLRAFRRDERVRRVGWCCVAHRADQTRVERFRLMPGSSS